MLTNQTLFTPAQSGLKKVGRFWHITRDGDPDAIALFMRHYSCRDPNAKLGRGNYARIGGPGERITLLTGEGDALFVWRAELKRMDEQEGVNCAVFRNEGDYLSSDLILDAEQIAWGKWSGRRLFTFVNPRKVLSSNPGWCFIKAGWRRCGVTSFRHLTILEKRPC